MGAELKNLGEGEGEGMVGSIAARGVHWISGFAGDAFHVSLVEWANLNERPCLIFKSLG